ncbi:SIMPL domain-containing protein [Cyanobacterium sp. IPPAS B-1200]|uniref:SIMPL domain-containing protein n=1 Tax=Cyanobacterium sp. IPPAS B-1200 TaxID=1562720 RepID=UPI001F5A095C|nr:SIMPL domain-containing protein [Cyanobacterium sp. IPPAS B-1200]
MLTSPVIAQEQIVKTITVTGQGIESIPATIATVQMGVEIEGQNPAQIQQEVAQRTTALLEILGSNNVEKLQTTGIQLRPNYRYDDNRRQLVNYTATNLVSFETSIDQVGTILDETVNVGATRIDSVSFTATENAINQAQSRALQKATDDAQRQSQAVLGALNLTPQEVITININGANTPRPLMMESMSDRAALSSAPSTPVVAGEQEVRASVTLQIRY